MLIVSGYVLLIVVYAKYISGIRSGALPAANPASWFVFTAISLGNAVVLWESITPLIRFFPLVMGVSQGIIAWESKKKKTGDMEKFDKIAMIVGVGGVILWTTSTLKLIAIDEILPIISMLIADAVGFYPTIRDAWNKPSREDIPVWGVFGFVGVLVLSGLWLDGKTGLDILYPIYETALAFSTVLVLFLRCR